MTKLIFQRILLLSLLALTAFAGIQESQKPNFSGVWRFNPARSKLQIPPPTSSVFRVDHREPEFHLSRTHVYEGKSDTWSIDLTTDRKSVHVLDFFHHPPNIPRQISHVYE